MTDDDQKRPRPSIPGKIPLPEDKDGTILLRSVEHAIRFGALANAGGVVATMTVLAAVAKNGDPIGGLAWPLGLFSAGVVCALITAASMVFILGDITSPTPGKWIGIWKYVAPALTRLSDFAAFGMLVFFIIGCIFGISIIATSP